MIFLIGESLVLHLFFQMHDRLMSKFFRTRYLQQAIASSGRNHILFCRKTSPGTHQRFVISSPDVACIAKFNLSARSLSISLFLQLCLPPTLTAFLASAPILFFPRSFFRILGRHIAAHWVCLLRIRVRALRNINTRNRGKTLSCSNCAQTWSACNDSKAVPLLLFVGGSWLKLTQRMTNYLLVRSLTHSFAPLSSLRSRASLRSFVCSLDRSLPSSRESGEF